MGTYIGFIEKRGYNSVFVNFKPIAALEDGQLRALSAEEQRDLLPESQLRNIYLEFSWRDQEQWAAINALCDEKSLLAFDFTAQDLQPHFNHSGERNQTGYKAPAMELIRSGRIRPIHDAGAHYVVGSDEILSDFAGDAIVEIDLPFARPGDQVFVEYMDMLAGPYEVNCDDAASARFIRPQHRKNGYAANGYFRKGAQLVELTAADSLRSGPKNRWTLFLPEGASGAQLDVITDEALVADFAERVRSELNAGGYLRLSDAPALTRRYSESLLSDSRLAEGIVRGRLDRLTRLLSDEARIDEALGAAADAICGLLRQHQDRPGVEKWQRDVLSRGIDELREFRVVAERISGIKGDVDALKRERAGLEAEIERRRAEADEIDRAAIQAKKDEMAQMDAEFSALRGRLERAQAFIGAAESVEALRRQADERRSEVAELDARRAFLAEQTGALESRFDQLLGRMHERAMDAALDGFVADRLMRAASEWERERAARDMDARMARLGGVPVADMAPDELTAYLCARIRTARPEYGKNAIINIAICMTQGFLTVFSGAPGCGKTSICNLFGEALGLEKVAETEGCDSRYVSVSVERGWTSKRDFVGYYNPLSKTFDRSNRGVYDALRLLDAENRAGIRRMPCVILLDEANLSPMEYYWSDFMNVCDDLSDRSHVNMGEDYVFGIPETLRFFATINNDQTTEALSPRLIDRAWVVSLPQLSGAPGPDVHPAPEDIRIVSWASLCRAFRPDPERSRMPEEIQNAYDAIVRKLREARFPVSARVDAAIRRYWAAASARFEADDSGADPDAAALDYAVAQRLLPRIAGNGDAFERWLGELRDACNDGGLRMSAQIVKDIIERGNRQMKYYQFFC